MGSSRQIIGVPACGFLDLVHLRGHSLVALLQIGVNTTAHNAHCLFAIARQGSVAHGTCVGCCSIEHVRCGLDFLSEAGLMLQCNGKQCPVLGLCLVQFRVVLL